MFKFSQFSIIPNQGQDDLKVLIDDETWQEYFVNQRNLKLEAHFESVVIQEINLKIFPSPQKDINFQLFNIDPIERECDIFKGKLFKSHNDSYYSVFHQQIISRIPYTRMRLIILNENEEAFKIFFFELKGDRILDEEERRQLQMEEEQKKQNKPVQRNVYKPGRSQAPEIKLGVPENFEEFIARVKRGINASNTIVSKDLDSEKQQQNRQEELKSEAKVNKNIVEKKVNYVEIFDDENSVQFLTSQNQNNTRENKNVHHFQKLQGCFTEQKQNYIDVQQRQQEKKSNYLPQPKPYFSQVKKQVNNEKFYLDNMIRYKANEINNEFLEFNKAIENSRHVPAKNRLIHRLNTNY